MMSANIGAACLVAPSRLRMIDRTVSRAVRALGICQLVWKMI